MLRTYCVLLQGIPIGTDPRAVSLAKEIPLPSRQLVGTWDIARGSGAFGKRKFLRLPYEHSNLKFGSSQSVTLQSSLLDKIEARGVGFSELQSYWSLPFHDASVVGDVTTFPDKHNRPLYDTVHVVTANPVVIIACRQMETLSLLSH